MGIEDIFQDALIRIYRPGLMSFALATSIIAIIICILDWIRTLLSGQASFLKVGYGGRRTLQSILLWGLGAGFGAYLGGLVRLFDIDSNIAPVLVGISWPTVLPRLLALAAEPKEEEEQSEGIEEEEIL